MPLSEHEQKMLEEMERQLFADDPKLAHAFRRSDRPRRSPKRLALGLGIAGLGLVLLVAAVLIPFVPAGVAGFLMMLGGIVWAILETPKQNASESSSPQGQRNGRTAAASPQRSGFVQRMEDRWDRRSGGGLG